MSNLSLKAQALRLLARREYSRVELQTKLAPQAESAEALTEALDDLEAKGFISAARVVQSVLHSKAAQWGQRRMAQTLAQKGIDADEAIEAIAQLQSTEGGSEFDRALALWQRRFGDRDTGATDTASGDALDGAKGMDEGMGEGMGEDDASDDHRVDDRAERRSPKGWSNAPDKQRAKQMRFLLSRGFGSDVVAKVLKAVSARSG